MQPRLGVVGRRSKLPATAILMDRRSDPDRGRSVWVSFDPRPPKGGPDAWFVPVFRFGRARPRAVRVTFCRFADIIPLQASPCCMGRSAGWSATFCGSWTVNSLGLRLRRTPVASQFLVWPRFASVPSFALSHGPSPPRLTPPRGCASVLRRGIMARRFPVRRRLPAREAPGSCSRLQWSVPIVGRQRRVSHSSALCRAAHSTLSTGRRARPGNKPLKAGIPPRRVRAAGRSAWSGPRTGPGTSNDPRRRPL